MQLPAILTRWIDALVAVAASVQEAWRTRRSLRISAKDGVLLVRGYGEDNPLLATVPLGKPFPENVKIAAANGFVVLELPRDNLVVRHISVPARAQDYLAGIVQNRIEQLSPWKPDQTTYGFEARPSSDDATALEVRVFITSRAYVQAAREKIADTGLAVDRIVAPDVEAKPDDPNLHNITLWSRMAEDAAQPVRLRRIISGGIAATVLASVAISAWAFMSAASLSSEQEDLAARTRAMQGQISARTNTSSLSPARRAWIEKETSPSAVLTLDALSRVLPTTAYLTDFDLQNDTLRIIGLAGDAPGTLAQMEQSGNFSNVHFFAPTTRVQDGKLYKFHVEAKVRPEAGATKP